MPRLDGLPGAAGQALVRNDNDAGRALCHKINVCLDKAANAEKKVEQFYTSAAIHIRDLQAKFPKTWQLMTADHCGWGRSRAYEILAIADGRKTAEGIRAETAARVKRHADQQGKNPLANGRSRAVVKTEEADEPEALPAEQPILTWSLPTRKKGCSEAKTPIGLFWIGRRGNERDAFYLRAGNIDSYFIATAKNIEEVKAEAERVYARGITIDGVLDKAPIAPTAGEIENAIADPKAKIVDGGFIDEFILGTGSAETGNGVDSEQNAAPDPDPCSEEAERRTREQYTRDMRMSASRALCGAKDTAKLLKCYHCRNLKDAELAASAYAAAAAWAKIAKAAQLDDPAASADQMKAKHAAREQPATEATE